MNIVGKISHCAFYLIKLKKKNTKLTFQGRQNKYKTITLR